MKKVWLVLGVLVAVALAFPASNLIGARPKATILSTVSTADPHFAPVGALLEPKCANCHTDEGKLPWYARLPIARSLVQRDLQAGLRELDLSAALAPGAGATVSEPVLAKLEYAVDTKQMPPGRYRAMHWDSHLHARDRQAIRGWIADLRMQHYAPAGLPAGVQARAIQPLPATVEVDSRKAALGAKLYADKRLSGDNTVACASCHDLAKGGADGERFSKGIRGQLGAVNAPTTFNSSFQFAQFWDGRAMTLEDQAGGPPNNPVEMGSNWAEITAKLSQDKEFAREFQAVYPAGIDPESICDAIATFERTLVTPDSRFDHFLMGDVNALTNDERHGYDLFLQHGCQTCHVGKLLGGQSFERMGRRADYFGDRGHIAKPDHGRFNVTSDPEDQFKLKVPTLRNVARTAPYFHDGSAPDLRSAVLVMAKYQVGTALTTPDAEAIAKFLGSLTGEYQGKKL